MSLHTMIALEPSLATSLIVRRLLRSLQKLTLGVDRSQAPPKVVRSSDVSIFWRGYFATLQQIRWSATYTGEVATKPMRSQGCVCYGRIVLLNRQRRTRKVAMLAHGGKVHGRCGSDVGWHKRDPTHQLIEHCRAVLHIATQDTDLCPMHMRLASMGM